jgi:hypothetical protein
MKQIRVYTHSLETYVSKSNYEDLSSKTVRWMVYNALEYTEFFNGLVAIFLIPHWSVMITDTGHAVALLVEALGYNQECRRFDSRWGHLIFHRPNPSSCTMALGSTSPVIEMSTRNLSGVKGGRPLQPHHQLWSSIVYKIWEPRRLITLWTSTASYRDSFTL